MLQDCRARRQPAVALAVVRDAVQPKYAVARLPKRACGHGLIPTEIVGKNLYRFIFCPSLAIGDGFDGGVR